MACSTISSVGAMCGRSVVVPRRQSAVRTNRGLSIATRAAAGRSGPSSTALRTSISPDLDGSLDGGFDDEPEVDSKSLEMMRKFSEQYAKRSGTYFCMDKSVTAVVIKGLAEHKDELGAPLCPCRHYDDKPMEVAQGFWNCPCVPMRERKECHCMLFLTEDNDFAGDEQEITIDEINEGCKGM